MKPKNSKIDQDDQIMSLTVKEANSFIDSLKSESSIDSPKSRDAYTTAIKNRRIHYQKKANVERVILGMQGDRNRDQEQREEHYKSHYINSNMWSYFKLI